MEVDDDNAPATRVFVGNLPNTVDEEVLRNEFSNYGTVDKIDLKSKGFGELQTQFAFVTLKYTTQHDISRCLKRFSHNEFHGQYLKVEVARESFLDRLKRERQEKEAQQIKKDKQPAKQQNESNNQINQTIPVLPAIQKKTFEAKSSSSSSSSSESSSSESESDEKASLKIHKDKTSVDGLKNHKAKTPIKTEESEIEDQPLFITKRNAQSSVQNGRIKIGNYEAEPIHVISKKSVGRNSLEGSAKQSDQKRKESLHKMKDQYNKQKLAIREALTNLDISNSNKSSKIVFDDENDVSVKTNSHLAKESTKRELFDDKDSEAESEDYSKDFKVKEQFQGEKGEKLMKLQSRFKLDPRFAMDERFLDEDEDNVKSEKKEPTSKAKPNENEERKWQLSLIEQVVGKKLTVEKPVQKKQLKGLITRFDPTKEEHKKFYKTSENDVEMLATKVKAEKTDNNEPAEVSQERFYKVSSDLKDILHSDNKGFSLLSMFGRAEEKIDRNDDSDEYNEVPLKKTKGSAIALNNPFKYDSSDSEDDTNETKPKSEKIPETKPATGKTKPNGVNKMGIPIESFFMFGLDKRMEEGKEFFKAPEINPDVDYQEVKRNLRTIIQRKIQKKRKHTEGFKTAASKFKKKRK